MKEVEVVEEPIVEEPAAANETTTDPVTSDATTTPDESASTGAGTAAKKKNTGPAQSAGANGFVFDYAGQTVVVEAPPPPVPFSYSGGIDSLGKL